MDKNKIPKLEQMSKEELRQTIIKKRECNARAQHIVESLLEANITEEYFMQILEHINQSHMDDILEERAIIFLCGYPLCSRNISSKEIPKQQYRISTKTNKVYDITPRKMFCSNSCYKSAMFIRNQMLSSPLWLRDKEVIPKFQLLKSENTGTLGQEINVSLAEQIKLKENFTPINDFAASSMEAIFPSQQSAENNNSEKKVERKDNKQKETKLDTSSCSYQKKSNIVGNIIEKQKKIINIDKKDSRYTRNAKIKPADNSSIIKIEQCLGEWFTIDTQLYLFGEQKVKSMVADKGECIKEYLNNAANGLFYKSSSYDHFQQLCRKLNMLELEDRLYDTVLDKRETKPLPDYEEIKEESKKLELKVRSFYAGEMLIVPSKDNTRDNKDEEHSNLTQLPLVDKNAQNALRRRILMNQLNKTLPDLMKSLGIISLSTTSDVRLLVNTFDLKANNITFKPIQWTMIGIIILKLLSLRDLRLANLMNQPTAYNHLQLLLLSYNQDGGYLDRLVTWLTDIDRLLDVNAIQLTSK